MEILHVNGVINGLLQNTAHVNIYHLTVRPSVLARLLCACELS